jgi:uncharacterized protein YxjI
MLLALTEEGPMEGQGALAVAGARDVAARFDGYQRLTVRQRKKWLEILLSFEMKNSYEVYDQTQTPVLRVQEEGKGFVSLIKRLFLGPFRPFEATVVDFSSGQPILRLTRPFRFIFHRLEVRTPMGEKIGAIQRRWSWLRRIYVIEDAYGHVGADLFGPILKPWTFEVRVNQQLCGMIQKRWSGLLKEAFTDADNFGVDLAAVEDANMKALTFAATVLIDVVHFERSKGG